MKQIVLITKQYPYSNREQFLDAELAYCSEKGIKIDIVSAFVSKKETRCRPLPEGIKSVRRFDAGTMGMKTLINAFRTFTSPVRAGEIKWLKNEKIHNSNKAKRAFVFLLKAMNIASEIEKLYKDKLEKSPEDIVLYSYWTEEAACAAAILKNKYGCKAVSRIHGYDLYVERHKESYFPFHRWMVSELSTVYPVSDYGREYLLGKYGGVGNIVTQKLATVDCGITPPAEDKITVVSCSNVIVLKRVSLIAEAMVKLNNKNLRWIHFGDGPLMDEVKKIASAPTDTECIIAGRVDHASIFEYYKKHRVDLFINVSTTEGLPVSIMEATSFGIPVIATDVGGTHEIVFDGVNGSLLSPELTSDDLKDAVSRFIGMSGEERNTYAENSRKIWLENYEHRTAYEKFYNGLML